MVQPAIRTIRVTLTDDAIEPRSIMVPADFPIRFVITNAGSREHEFAIPHEDYSADLLPGETREVTWTLVGEGTFEIVSRDDDDAAHGLKGKITVEAVI
jgi:uncharacterized cupredoxin-like copper-binding protein